MSAAEIRPAGPCDVALLAELNRLCFAPGAGDGFVGTPWSVRSMAEMLALPGTFALLALADGTPVGFLLAQVLFEEAELLTLGVLPARRRSGWGRRLLDSVLEEADRRGAIRIQLEVAENNQSAQDFYQRLGFRPAGRRRNYYLQADGSALDALVLARPLSPAAPAGRCSVSKLHP